MEDIAMFFSGGTPTSTNSKFYGGDIPFIRSGEINANNTELFLTEEGLKNSAAKIVEIGDVLLALYGATSGQISISKIRGAINQAILCIRTKMDPLFLKSIWSRHLSKILNAYLQGGQGNLSADIVKSLSFYFPSDREQQRISLIISLLDERIAIQNKIIEDLKGFLSAIYYKVFSNIKGEYVTLKSVANVIKGKQLNLTELSISGDYYVMNGGITPSGYYHKYNTKANIISISEGGNSCGYVQFNKTPFWSGGHCYTLHLTQELNPIFLFHFLKYIEKDIMALRIGSGLPNIQKTDLENIRVLRPIISIQNRSVFLFEALQKKLDIENQIRCQLFTQKKSLLSQLFI